MPVEILIHAFDHEAAQKGTPQTVKDDDDLAESPWGSKEGLPNYVVLRITDATKSQVLNYLDNWKREIEFTLLGSNAQGRRYKLSMNPKIITEFGQDAGFHVDFRNYLEDYYGAVLVSWDQSIGEATFDIPNTEWAELAADVRDKFEAVLANRRYYFDPADVDVVVASGGFITQTTSQALSRIIDRLA